MLDGRFVPYVNLDNAASTPAFRSVVRAVDEFLPFYSGVHRGTGYKSRLSTDTFERARELVGEFLGADPERDVVVFTKNTTEAINKLARALPVESDAVVLTTMLEHHSNDLPWRSRLRTVHVGVCPDGALDVDDLDRRLAEYAGRVALLAVSGASNVTGVVQPVHQLAREGPCRRRSDPRRRRPTRATSRDRHAGPRRSRSSRLRRPLGPQDVCPVRHGSPRRATLRLRPDARPRRRGHGECRHHRDRRVGRPARPGGSGQPQRARCGRPRRRDTNTQRDRT